jgi:fibro-slime domain-containing protein
MVGRRATVVAALAVLAAGCAEVKGNADSGAGGTGGLPPLYDAAGRRDGPTRPPHDPPPPAVYTMNNSYGGYKLGEWLPVVTGAEPTKGIRTCDALIGVVRDFKAALPPAGGSLEPGGHPDFEVFEGMVETPGLVMPDMPDMGLKPRKPIYASACELGAPVSTKCPHGAMTTTKANFDQWYSSTEGVNYTYLVYLKLEPGANGVPTFQSEHFFPLDGYGWGNNGLGFDDMGHGNVPHNYAFTTEVHTVFQYRGGEHFNFEGDDDVWVFINGKLAVDLGGLHKPRSGPVDLDAQAAALGITKGNPYSMDLFHAERHSIDSNFHLELNFTFEDCGYVVP